MAKPVRELDPDVLASSFTTLRQIVLPALAPHGGRVYLFGSHARGDARWTSDIDLAIEADQPLPPTVLQEIIEAIEESTVPYHVDVVDLGRVDRQFADRVHKEGRLWTE